MLVSPLVNSFKDVTPNSKLHFECARALESLACFNCGGRREYWKLKKIEWRNDVQVSHVRLLPLHFNNHHTYNVRKVEDENNFSHGQVISLKLNWALQCFLSLKLHLNLLFKILRTINTWGELKLFAFHSKRHSIRHRTPLNSHSLELDSFFGSFTEFDKVVKWWGDAWKRISGAIWENVNHHNQIMVRYSISAHIFKTFLSPSFSTVPGASLTTTNEHKREWSTRIFSVQLHSLVVVELS